MSSRTKKPTLKPKLVKEYGCPNAEEAAPDKTKKCNNEGELLDNEGSAYIRPLPAMLENTPVPNKSDI